jgi:hypothetical protein
MKNLTTVTLPGEVVGAPPASDFPILLVKLSVLQYAS